MNNTTHNILLNPMGAITFGILILLPFASAEAEVMVVHSSGPSAPNFTVGRTLSDDSQFALVVGDKVTILDNRGTRVYKGPANVNLAKSIPSDSRTIQLFFPNERQITRVVGVRGAMDARSMISIRTQGKRCFSPGVGISIFAGDSNRIRRVFVRDIENSVERQLIFAAGETKKLLPFANRQPGSSTRFELGLVGGPAAQVDVVIMKSAPSGNVQWAAEALKQGCIGQLTEIATAD